MTAAQTPPNPQPSHKRQLPDDNPSTVIPPEADSDSLYADESVGGSAEDQADASKPTTDVNAPGFLRRKKAS
ncbi:hypothetical protein J7E62_05135 [Variovorax paradoxus]|nr:hypothetical protein [Variovorax paradoxus]